MSKIRAVEWLEADDIKLLPQWHSDAMNIRTLLVAMPERNYYPQATLGYFIGGLVNEWRVVGSPSKQHPTHWMPLPELPDL